MPLIPPKDEANSIVAALLHKPDVMYHLLDSLPGRLIASRPGSLIASSPPVAEVRTIAPTVTLFARLTDDEPDPETVLCLHDAERLGVPMTEFGNLPGARYFEVKDNPDRHACIVCGAGDPANDETVFWCPVCDAATNLREVDFDIRQNDIEIAEDHNGEPYGQISEQDSNYDTLALLCDNDHVLGKPENFNIEWN
jgi:hypothetical protein